MNWKLLLLGIALVGMVVAGFLLRTETGPQPRELTILHTNDLHAHYDSFEPWGEPVQGGIARLATAIEEIRNEAENVLLLDAGDQFQGTLFYTVGGAEVVADVMNELQYDAMCIGNHEFDSGPAELATLIELASFPVLSANVDAASDADLAGEILPYAVYRLGRGQPIGVLGLTTEHTATASSPGPDVHFVDATDAAQRAVDELEASGIDIIIALTHLGYEHDLALAEAVDGIDVVIGGHSHTRLDAYPTVVESASGEPVLVATAYEWGKQLGRLDVRFTDDGRVETYAGAPIPIVEAIPEDGDVLDILDAYRPEIDALMSHRVGSTEVDLDGARENVRVRETNLGNLICDAILAKTAGLGATISIHNGGGIRASIPAGEITMGQVLEVLQYGNQITVVMITGAELIAALENGVSGVEDAAGRFPHVGGLWYTFDPAAAPGERIGAVEVWDAATQRYAAVDPMGSYTVATNNYLADGGDGYDYAGASDRYDSGWLLSDALAEYLSASGPVVHEVEGRIVETAPDTP